MNKLIAVIKNSRGITLVEILVAGLMTFILAAAVMEFYVSQHGQVLVQEQISDMQQNGRAAMNEIAAQVRQSGYGLPDSMNCILGYNSNPDSIVLVYSKGPGCDVTIEWQMPQPSAELRCDGHDLSCFNDNEWAYIFDPNTNTGEYFYITKVQMAPAHIQHNLAPLSKAYPKGSYVISIDRLKYYVDNSDAAHPKLMRQKNFGAAQVYAEDVTDLQFTYTLSDGTTTSAPSANAIVKSVQLTVNARTMRADEKYVSNSGYRNRNLNTRVFVRNAS